MFPGEFFATAAKGLETLVAAELEQIGVGGIEIERGGVRFRGDETVCYRANLWLRSASRILAPLGSFPCLSPDDLYQGVRAFPWHHYLTPSMTLAVDSHVRDSRLTHSGFVALKTKDAVVDAIRERAGRRPDVDPCDPDLRINVHLVKDQCTVSLDTSGEPLDRRGYRLDRSDAPLRETLAAALVDFSGWDGMVPFVDPMCGSGTMVIEAALKTLRIAPGLIGRRFGFSRWPGFAPELWAQLLAEAHEQRRSPALPPIWGLDVDRAAIRKARQNAERAGVETVVRFSEAGLADLQPPQPPGVILSNPPFGVRLGDEETLLPLYRQLGDVLKQRCHGYTACILTANRTLASAIHLRPHRRTVIWNGPLECRLLHYRLH